MWHAVQAVGVGDMWVPTSVKPVTLWSNEAASHPAVVWQFAQLAAANPGPAPECTGLFVYCQVVRWQPELPQSVGAILSAKLALMWHALQATVVCLLVSGNPVVLWSNFPAAQVVIG